MEASWCGMALLTQDHCTIAITRFSILFDQARILLERWRSQRTFTARTARRIRSFARIGPTYPHPGLFSQPSTRPYCHHLAMRQLGQSTFVSLRERPLSKAFRPATLKTRASTFFAVEGRSSSTMSNPNGRLSDGQRLRLGAD